MFGNEIIKNFSIDYTSKDHLQQISAIEKLNNGSWTIKDFDRHMYGGFNNGLTALHNNIVVGYGFYSMHSECLHLVNLGVHPDYIRKGIGTRVINRLKLKLTADVKKISYLVPERNLNVQNFLSKLDFKAIEIKNNWFRDQDGYLFEYFKIKEK